MSLLPIVILIAIFIVLDGRLRRKRHKDAERALGQLGKGVERLANATSSLRTAIDREGQRIEQRDAALARQGHRHEPNRHLDSFLASLISDVELSPTWRPNLGGLLGVQHGPGAGEITRIRQLEGLTIDLYGQLSRPGSGSPVRTAGQRPTESSIARAVDRRNEDCQLLAVREPTDLVPSRDIATETGLPSSYYPDAVFPVAI